MFAHDGSLLWGGTSTICSDTSASTDLEVVAGSSLGIPVMAWAIVSFWDFVLFWAVILLLLKCLLQKLWILFLWYLRINQHLLDKPEEQLVNDNALVALALLVAESLAEQKELMIRLVEHFILLKKDIKNWFTVAMPLSLISCRHYFLKKFKELAVKRVYVIRAVLEFEVCGFDVFSGLLDVFVQPLKLDVVEE